MRSMAEVLEPRALRTKSKAGFALVTHGVMQGVHPEGVAGLEDGSQHFQTVVREQAGNGRGREKVPVTGDVVAAPIGALKEAGIQAVEIGRFQG